MGNLVEAFVAMLGLLAGFFALGVQLSQPGPWAYPNETGKPEQFHDIHQSSERLAA